MKKSSRRESLIVNNFFTLASIVMIAITIILYSKYISNDDYKNDNLKDKVITLSCEKEVFSTSKVYNQKLLNESQKALDKGFYRLNGQYKKATYSDSIIEDFINNELDYVRDRDNVDEFLEEQIIEIVRQHLVKSGLLKENK